MTKNAKTTRPINIPRFVAPKSAPTATKGDQIIKKVSGIARACNTDCGNTCGS